MSLCPCCSHKLLCHISHKRIYWFCSGCWQEMPNLNLLSQVRLTESLTDFTDEYSDKSNSTNLKEIHA